MALAEQRGTDDNLSIQVMQINEVEKVALYRGVAMYQETADPTTRYELRPGQVLDNRFQILETISRSGMAHHLQGNGPDHQTDRGGEGPAHAV